MPVLNAKTPDNHFELKTDDLVLGRVKEIDQFKLIVSLPSCGNGKPIFGSVKIFDICDAYKKLLEQLIDENEEQLPENVSDLSSLFQIGQLVRCVILSINDAKTVINLSMNPRLLHQNILRSNLKGRMCMHCAVVSVEDHGYIMETGIKGMRTFLSHGDASQFESKCNSDSRLSVGQMVPCRLKDSDSIELKDEDNRVQQLTADPTIMKETILLESIPLVFGCLVPGVWIKAKINKINKSGSVALVVRFQNYLCNISRLHVYGSLNDYEVNKEVVVCIVSSDPTHKVLTGSLLPHLLPAALNFDAYMRAKIGSIYEDAEVQKVDKSQLILWLPQVNIKALVRRVMTSDNKTVTSHLSEHFSKESNVKCRVLDFDLMNNVAIAATKQSVIEQTYLNYNDIQPGDIVQVELVKFINDGILVSLTNKIQGIVPYIHLADAKVSKPQEKFKQGDSMKARVLTVEATSKKLILTLKPSLIKSKLPALVSRDQLSQSDLLSSGFVVLVQDHGLLVSFYNDIKGWVSRDEMGIGEGDVVSDCFYRGQVVKCRIIRYISHSNRLYLSLKLEGKVNIGQSKSHKLQSIPVDIGQIFTATIVTKETDHFGVKLKSNPGSPFNEAVIARLDFIHLSDFPENSTLLSKSMKIGGDLETVVINKSSSIIVSAKKSLIKATQCEEFVTKFHQLVVGSQWLGWVRNKKMFGLFVEFPGGYRGLVPNKMILDGHPPYSPTELFDIGQTVEVKVVELQEQKARCLLSLRMSSVYHAWKHLEKASLEPIVEILNERKFLVDSGVFGFAVSKFKLGDVIRVKINSVNDVGILGEVKISEKSVIPCLAVTSNTRGATCHVETHQEAIYLYTDLTGEQATLEVCLSTAVVRAVKETKQHTSGNKVKLGQAIKCQVVLIKKSFVLVMLLDHAHGKFAYLPTRKHWNDSLQINKYVIGQINRVVVKQIMGDVIICNLKIHEPIGEENLHEITRFISSKDAAFIENKSERAKLGDKLDVRIFSILKYQLNIFCESTKQCGRVFISQVTDNLIDKQSPLSSFQKDQNVTVKVIGFRRSEKINQDSKTLFSRNLLECSLKSCAQSEPNNYKVGDTFPIFFKEISRIKGGNTDGFFIINSKYYKNRLAVLNAVDTSTHAKGAKTFFKDYKIGSALLNARVFQIEENAIRMTLLDEQCLDIGRPVCAQVYKIESDRCLVRLPRGGFGFIHFFDMPWIDNRNKAQSRRESTYPENTSVILNKRSVGEYVSCKIIAVEETGHEEQKKKVFVLTNRSIVLRTSINDPNEQLIEEPNKEEFVIGYIFKKTMTHAFVCISRTIIGAVNIPTPNLANYFAEGKSIKVKTVGFSENNLIRHLEYEESFLPSNIDSDIDSQRNGNLSLSSDEEKTIFHDYNDIDQPLINSPMSRDSLNDTKRKTSRKRKLSGELSEPNESQSEKKKKGTEIEEEDAKSNSSKKRKVSPELSNQQTHKTEKRVQPASEIISKKRKSKVEMDEEEPILHEKIQRISRHSADSKSFKSLKSLAKDFQINEMENDLTESLSIDSSDQDEVADSDGGNCSDKELAKPIFKRNREPLSESVISSMEQKRLEKNIPSTSHEFDIAVKSNPNSSELWTAYMAFYLKSGDLAKARAVAERSLTRIDSQCSKDQTNMFVAMLNMEAAYGTETDFNRVFQRAATISSPLLFSKAYTLLIKDQNFERAEEIARQFVKNCSSTIDSWILLIRARFQGGKSELARGTLHNALKTLKKNQHVDLLIKMGNLEFEMGDAERGVKIFSELTQTYPKRLDCHLARIQALLLAGREDQAKLARDLAMKSVKEKDKQKIEKIQI